MALSWHCHGTITDTTTEESAPSMTENKIPQGDTATPFRYTAALAETIETSWQDRWEAEGTFNADNPVGALAGPDVAEEKFFLLDMFPYPSGKGLHEDGWGAFVPARMDSPSLA